VTYRVPHVLAFGQTVAIISASGLNTSLWPSLPFNSVKEVAMAYDKANSDPLALCVANSKGFKVPVSATTSMKPSVELILA